MTIEERIGILQQAFGDEFYLYIKVTKGSPSIYKVMRQQI